MPRARNPRRIDAPVPQQHRGAVELEVIAVGQNQRTVLEDTHTHKNHGRAEIRN